MSSSMLMLVGVGELIAMALAIAIDGDEYTGRVLVNGLHRAQ